ncbi:MAG: molecular chaperone TorD family protein [Euryarchaeota archaeon]|nr:molecular chaperone TorD family protein [Euryarchaeota archaeon]
MNKKIRKFIKLAEGRSDVYKFLSFVYSKPSKEFVDKIKESKFLSIETAELEEFEVEYTRLFAASGEHYIPPYESVYKDKWTIDYVGMPHLGLPPRREVVEGLLWGDSTVAVQKKYRKAGLEVSENDREIPDHISVELEFMHYLCGKEAEAWKSGNKSEAVKYLEMQKEFLNEHLAAWVEKFCTKVEERAQYDFYRIMARLTREYVRLEQAEIESFIENAKLL